MSIHVCRSELKPMPLLFQFLPLLGSPTRLIPVPDWAEQDLACCDVPCSPRSCRRDDLLGSIRVSRWQSSASNLVVSTSILVILWPILLPWLRPRRSWGSRPLPWPLARNRTGDPPPKPCNLVPWNRAWMEWLEIGRNLFWSALAEERLVER